MMEVYEKGKSRLVSIDILKEFRGDNNTHGFPSDFPADTIRSTADTICSTAETVCSTVETRYIS